MQTGLYLEAFYVSCMNLSDKHDRQKRGQDLRQKADSAANNLVQVQRALSFVHFIPTKEGYLEDQNLVL